LVKPRASIGHVKESSVPEGVHWDLYLGPTKYQPFTLNKFHYAWHFNWDTSTTDVGNTGVHHFDAARWGLNKNVHPVKVHSTGGYYVWDSDQETPNFQVGTLEYALCHLANISYRLGRKLVFDPATETFPGDAKANGLLTRQYRAPYTLPDKV
jgi:hypothetical protein